LKVVLVVVAAAAGALVLGLYAAQAVRKIWRQR